MLFDDDGLRDGCHEVRFHTTLRGSSVVVLVYNRPIDNDKNWRTKAEKLAKSLKVVLVGSSSKFRVTLNGDAPRVREKLHIAGKDVNLYQLEGEFSQPNGRVCEKDGDVGGLIRRPCLPASVLTPSTQVERTASSKNDLLELYCGNGNFTGKAVGKLYESPRKRGGEQGGERG